MLFRAVVIVFSLYHACSAWATDIIAHRGASGYLPEHTLEGATLAFAQHPDYIEQDVVLSADNIPIVLHDIHLETVTNVEEVFPERARQDGRFYVKDFLLDELRQLSIHERHDSQSKPVFTNRYTGEQARFTVSTLAEHIELINQLNRAYDRKIGMYIEIKSPAWHHKEGADISTIVLSTLEAHDMLKPSANVIIQCFDFAETTRIRQKLGFRGTLIQLIGENSWEESDTDYTRLLTPSGLADIAKVADGIGPWIPLLFAQSDENEDYEEVSSWVSQAKALGLLIHPYTFRLDALPPNLSGQQLMKLLFDKAGVDGLFTDQVPPVKAYLNKSR